MSRWRRTSIACSAAGVPEPAIRPIERSSKPNSPMRSGATSSRRASASRASPSAIGLRHVLPVHTKPMRSPAVARSWSRSRMPPRRTSKCPGPTFSTTDDSPSAARPASSTNRSSSPKASSTGAASTIGGAPAAFALVATTGNGSASSIWARLGSAGIRMPVQPSRAAASRPAGTPGSTRVNGPGQYLAASRRAMGEARGKRSSASREPTCHVSGRSGSLPLSCFKRCSARGSSARAAMPYTVSVGTATSSPCSSARAARLRSPRETARWSQGTRSTARSIAPAGGP